MADPEELKELSEDDLFNDAVGEVAAEAVAETAGEVTEQAGKVRDEAGRFVGKPENEPEVVAADEKPPIPPKPEWRKQEDAERARAAESELANERAEKAALRQRLDALERANHKPEPAAEKAAKPDPLLDPEGYAKAVREEVKNDLLMERREESLVRAREANQQEFDEAYAAAQTAVDPALRARMQSSRDPGKTLIDWHRENKVRAEVGLDPNAWLEKKMEERLKDPAFLAKAVELARGSASTQRPDGRPRVEMPLLSPSLNGASRSNAALRSAMTADIDDDALFDQTTA